MIINYNDELHVPSVTTTIEDAVFMDLSEEDRDPNNWIQIFSSEVPCPCININVYNKYNLLIPKDRFKNYPRKKQLEKLYKIFKQRKVIIDIFGKPVTPSTIINLTKIKKEGDN